MPPRRLAEEHVTLDADSVRVNGYEVRAVFFSEPVHQQLSIGVEDDDQNFCDQETAALWLAIHRHRAVTAINSLDAEIWYSRSEWAVWNRRFRDAGLPTAPIRLGGSEDETHWLSWGGGLCDPPGPAAARALLAALVDARHLTSTFLVFGRAFPERRQEQHPAGEWLAARGVNFAELLTNQHGETVACTAFPNPDGACAPNVAYRLAEAIDANSCCW